MPSTTMDANAIQKLYEVCKVSLSEKGPLSSESLDNVRAVLGKNCLQFPFGSLEHPIQPKGWCKIDMNQEKRDAFILSLTICYI